MVKRSNERIIGRRRRGFHSRYRHIFTKHSNKIRSPHTRLWPRPSTASSYGQHQRSTPFIINLKKFAKKFTLLVCCFLKIFVHLLTNCYQIMHFKILSIEMIITSFLLLLLLLHQFQLYSSCRLSSFSSLFLL